MSVIKKARELGREIHKTAEYREMDANLTIQAYAKAQNDFNLFMQNINNAIGEEIDPGNNE